MGEALNWPVHVINMAANTERWARTTRQLDALGIAHQRFEAVDGSALTPDEIAAVYDATANRRSARHDLIGPEIGCYLSHIGVWREITAGDAPGAIILEDDFEARDSLPHVLRALAQDPQGWDLVKLFALQDAPRLMQPHPLIDGHQIGAPYKVPTCTVGYALTRAGARKLLDRVPRFYRPVDEDHKYRWEHGLKIALVTPPPLTEGNQEAQSETIGAARRAAYRHGPGQALRSIRVQAAYQMRVRWWRWKEYRTW